MSEYCKVLIVDDEYIMRQGMKHMLDWENEGFTIVGEASNGEEALELIPKVKPHIILSDIVMPIIDGMEFVDLVQERYPEIQIIILSSFDNFEYVKRTLLSGVVDYILKPTLNPAELLITLKKAVDRIPNFELNKNEDVSYKGLMERYLLGFDENLNTTAFINCFPDSCFRLFGINLKQCFGNDKTLKKEINSKIDEFFLLHNEYNVLKLELNDEVLCCIVNYKVSLNVNIINGIRELSKNKKYFSDSCFLVLGREFKDINKIRDEYNDIFLPHLPEHFYYSNQRMLIIENDQKTVKKEIKFNLDEYYRLIKNNEFNSAINIFDKYVNDLIENKSDEYTLKNMTKNLLFNLAASTENEEINIDKLRKEYFKKIDNAKSVEEFKKIFEEIISCLKADYQEENNCNEFRIKEIIEYINKHYEQHLDLMEISKVFNFNYYYLSAYFNTHSKEGFNEYLNKLRVKKSCELLKNSSMSVSEVSSRVGYADHSYFCRVFKKITGVTPSKFRRNEVTKVGELNES